MTGSWPMPHLKDPTGGDYRSGAPPLVGAPTNELRSVGARLPAGHTLAIDSIGGNARDPG